MLGGLAALWLAAAAPLAPAASPETTAPPAPVVAPISPPVPVPPQPQPDMGPDVRAAFRSAEAARGALDGSWRLDATASGEMLYVFQLADSGGAPDPYAADPQAPGIEGAWRDPRHAGDVDGSGFIAACHRDGDDLVILFYAAGGRAQTVTLHPAAGGWDGELDTDAARVRVTMRRY